MRNWLQFGAFASADIIRTFYSQPKPERNNNIKSWKSEEAGTTKPQFYFGQTITSANGGFKDR